MSPVVTPRQYPKGSPFISATAPPCAALSKHALPSEGDSPPLRLPTLRSQTGLWALQKCVTAETLALLPSA